MMGRIAPLLSLIAPGRTWGALYQSGFKMTEGTTLSATGTTPPVITFSGTRNGKPYPIWVKCNTTGGALGVWTGDVYYDGAGTTSEQSFTSAATVALTGKGAGLTLNIAAGNAATNNVWKATCGTWGDLAATPHDMTQATATKQPIITAGLNGWPGLLFDGSSQNLVSSGYNLAAPGTTNFGRLLVARQITWTTGKNLVGETSNGNVGIIHTHTATPSIAAFNTSNSTDVAMTLNTWFRVRALWSNSTGDYLKVGATSVTGVNLGNSSANGQEIASAAGAGFANIEVLAYGIWTGGDLSAADIAAVDAAIGVLFGSGNVSV